MIIQANSQFSTLLAAVSGFRERILSEIFVIDVSLHDQNFIQGFFEITLPLQCTLIMPLIKLDRFKSLVFISLQHFQLESSTVADLECVQCTGYPEYPVLMNKLILEPISPLLVELRSKNINES